jgi:hypothetical protein
MHYCHSRDHASISSPHSSLPDRWPLSFESEVAMRVLRQATCVFAAVWLTAITSGAAAQTPEPPTSFQLAPDKAVQEPKASPQVQTTGSLTRMVPIEAPAFFGIEPHLALAYSSQAGNGLAGVGWSLSGVSTIERTRNGRGTPRYDANDVYVLDGQPLLTCAVAASSPGCQVGGTHATKNESYLKIVFASAANTWTISALSGIRRVYAAVFPTMNGTFRWALSSVVDGNGNTVTYNWVFAGGDAHLDSVSYGPFTVRIYRESRPDVGSFAIGVDTELGWSNYRIRSVLVARGAAPIRAYALQYETSPSTGRSRLARVQQYGTDVAIDGAGAIGGGTSLPAQVFHYQDEPTPGTLHSWPDGAGVGL